MKPVPVHVAYQGKPQGEAIFGANQEGVQPIHVAPLQHGDGTMTLLTRWRLTEDERAAVAAGADVFVGVVHATNDLMRPLAVGLDPRLWLLDKLEPGA